MIWYLSLWILGTTIRLTQKYAPTNIIAGFIRSRRGHKWGIPIAAALVPAYALAFNRVADTATATNTGWLYLLALLMFWNAGKVLALGILSVVLLARARVREWTWGREPSPISAAALVRLRLKLLAIEIVSAPWQGEFGDAPEQRARILPPPLARNRRHACLHAQPRQFAGTEHRCAPTCHALVPT